MKTLTKAEEQVMQVLWKLKEGFIRDIMDAMPPPRPHQNTIATLLKILIEKEFVGIRIFGRQHQYHPLVSKDSYSKASIRSLVKSYFGGSFSDAVSFMVKENSISVEDLETLLQQLKKGKK
ncbi:BlaI/MecI/CopY family transcriptional regulator [Flavisolibacter ginsengisoli]|jgi:predicted transcriptional regulator|uniref:Predicted transcriptional regulator n=1 Tax=Flavisolibacter ginsengisoli DSM 18119 TaxID=1121884 RepID=A0A1M4XI96_9BACT|nr:BlaI/MecI/CopY family transcriptional regulator [Flavisolibacter ginsengisoli]SHE92882.1 Predicted transcriptional regulator [Flavisolibacter ginsengisoli DSM 18119]